MKGLFCGLATWDIFYQLADFPQPNSKNNAEAVAQAAGGPALNAAVMFSHCGGDAILCTALGESLFAHAIAEDLSACGVLIVDRAKADYQPPLSSILVHGTGERTVLTAKSASLTATLEPLPVDELLQGVDVVLCDGHHAEGLVPLLQAAQQRNIPVVVDAGSWKPVWEDLWPLVDYCVASADFTFANGSNDLATWSQCALRHGWKGVVVTRGHQAMDFWHNGEWNSLPVSVVDVVDSTGAGDFFHGAFAAAIVQDKKIAQALGWASEKVAPSLSHLGTRSWLP